MQGRGEEGQRAGVAEGPDAELPGSGYLSKMGTQIKAGLPGPTFGLRREKSIGIGQENAREVERTLIDGQLDTCTGSRADDKGWVSLPPSNQRKTTSSVRMRTSCLLEGHLTEHSSQ